MVSNRQEYIATPIVVVVVGGGGGGGGVVVVMVRYLCIIKYHS
jgi:acetyl-CoA carboxylase alpha subunit